MSSPIDLTTIANATDWLQITNPDSATSSRIDRLITSTSAQIQKFLGYQIASTSYTRTFDGNGGSVLILPDRPVTAVSGVQVGSVVLPVGAAGQGGFYPTEDGVELVGYVFGCGARNVTVSYMAGYASVPPDIEQACLEMISGAVSSQARDPAVIRERAGDTEFQYASGSGKGGTQPIPASILAYLQPYRRVA